MCVRSLRYPAWKALGPYYIVVHGLPGCAKVFQIISQTAQLSGEKIYWSKYVCFNFLYNFSETFIILRRFQRDIIINVHRSLYKVTVIPVRFLKIACFQQILEKYWQANFHENSFNRNRVVSCGWRERQTDRHDKANSHFLQWWERPPPRNFFPSKFMFYLMNLSLALDMPHRRRWWLVSTELERVWKQAVVYVLVLQCRYFLGGIRTNHKNHCQNGFPRSWCLNQWLLE